MRVGAQFLIAVRLLCSMKQLQAQLLLKNSDQHVHLHCIGDSVVYAENSRQFPMYWLESKGETSAAAALRAAPSEEARRRALQDHLQDQSKRQAFAEAVRYMLTPFFQKEILECRLKQEAIGESIPVLNIPNLILETARPF